MDSASVFWGSPLEANRYNAVNPMQITLAHVGSKIRGGDPIDSLASGYLDRSSEFARCEVASFRNEVALLEWVAKQQGRVPAVPAFLDSRGRQMTSEAFAAWLGTHRDTGTQHIIFAVGPADGWSDMARAKAKLLLSLGDCTLPHSLARLIIAEQIYRAFTILSGHPYHTGH